jgi:hypothetical protein
VPLATQNSRMRSGTVSASRAGPSVGVLTMGRMIGVAGDTSQSVSSAPRRAPGRCLAARVRMQGSMKRLGGTVTMALSADLAHLGCDTLFAHPGRPYGVADGARPRASAVTRTRDPSEMADDSLDLRCHPPSAPGAFSPLSMWSSTHG